jgi:hypothetical protein
LNLCREPNLVHAENHNPSILGPEVPAGLKSCGARKHFLAGDVWRKVYGVRCLATKPLRRTRPIMWILKHGVFWASNGSTEGTTSPCSSRRPDGPPTHGQPSTANAGVPCRWSKRWTSRPPASPGRWQPPLRAQGGCPRPLSPTHTLGTSSRCSGHAQPSSPIRGHARIGSVVASSGSCIPWRGTHRHGPWRSRGIARSRSGELPQMPPSAHSRSAGTTVRRTSPLQASSPTHVPSRTAR